MEDVSVFGSINVDLVTEVDREQIENLRKLDQFPQAGETKSIQKIPSEYESKDYEIFMGGKGANQAVAASYAGATSKLLGKVGFDAEEYDILSNLERRGVNIDEVQKSDSPTGKAYIFVDENGENRINIVEGSNGDVDLDYVDEIYDRILESEILLLQNEVPLDTTEYLIGQLEQTKNRPYTIFDPAPSEGVENISYNQAIDILTPNEGESKSMRGLKENALIANTLGEKGVRLGSNIYPAPKVEAVDTTAAGDVFNGYLAAKIAEGEEINDSLKTAIMAASNSVQKEGAQNSIPKYQDISI
jgi:ribokinase